MPLVQRNAEVPYSAPQMYDLVNNIEKYPEFLPWCRASIVHCRDEDEVRATLELAKGGLHKSFTTLNRLQKDKMIEVRLISGPFQHLEGFWRFEELDSGGCKVSLDLEFEFGSKLLSMAVGPVFNPVANTFVDLFCKRAEEVYGDADAS